MRLRQLILALAPLAGGVAFAAGETPAFIPQLTLLLLVSAVVAYLFFRLGITPIVGFLVAGVVIGPNALGLITDPALIDAAAEIGVILLLFTIGIEFSLEKLAAIRRLIFVGGGAQVALVTGVTTLLLLPFTDPRSALFTGMLLALSSTAIVMKLLADRAETNSTSGRSALGILIFQDLAVVLMVLLVPLLGGEGGGVLELAWALTKAGGIIALVLLLAGRVMPRLLEAVARTCSQEIFLITVVGICFGTAYLTSLAGVSLSLGAFLAGLLVSESRFGQQALGDILPLQILFSAAFFLSVGLLLDLGFLVANLPLVLLILVGILALKTAATVVSLRLIGVPLAAAGSAGLLLAQVGEFSFVLERAGREVGLSPAGLGPEGAQAFIACTVLLMTATPLLASLGRRLERRLSGPGATAADAEIPHEGFDDLDGHVVVGGFGAGARRLARALEAAEIPFGIVTLSPTGGAEAEARGWRVLQGDYAQHHILGLAGIDRASLLVVPDDEPAMAERVVSVTRTRRPDLEIVVCTRFDAFVGELEHAGASVVVSEQHAAATLLTRTALERVGVAPPDVRQLLERLDRETDDRAVEPEPISLSAEQLRADCPGMDSVTSVPGPAERVCPECVAAGDGWVHLRICMTCGHVGCCDSSKNKHATAHFHATGHPVVRSLEPGESWAWCYPTETMLEAADG